jgi:hypothetical protein
MSGRYSTTGDVIPKGWEWVLSICTEARFPDLGMPVQWKNTEDTHTTILVDPITGKTFDHIKGSEVKSAIGFIKSTKGANPMPGAEAPAAVRFALYSTPELQRHSLFDSDGNSLVPCIVHGDYVKVESLQADHLQAKENIKKRQNELVSMLNAHPSFAKFILEQPGMNKFFVKHTDDKYYGTLFFYEIYFNDIDNLWLICGACNLHKSNKDTLEWLKNQWLYGQEFLDYLSKCSLNTNKGHIIQKVQDGRGLAEVAISWFWKRHANYISTAKALLVKLTTPIQILNKQVDHILGSGNYIRAERLQASLDARILLAGSMIGASIGMPKGENEDSDTSSDADSRISMIRDANGQAIPCSPRTYLKAAEECVPEIREALETGFRSKLQAKLKLRQSTSSLSC